MPVKKLGILQKRRKIKTRIFGMEVYFCNLIPCEKHPIKVVKERQEKKHRGTRKVPQTNITALRSTVCRTPHASYPYPLQRRTDNHGHIAQTTTARTRSNSRRHNRMQESVCLEKGEPVLKRIVFSLHHAKERLLEFMAEGARTAIPDGAIIHFTNRG